jgi:hypothetical protein
MARLRGGPTTEFLSGRVATILGSSSAGKFSAWPMLMALWRLQQGYARRE